MLVAVVDRHLSSLPRVLMVAVALVDELSDSHPPVQEHPYFTVLGEHEVPRIQGSCTADMDAFLAVVGHVKRYTALPGS